MKRIKRVDIRYWFPRQKENPMQKSKELEDELNSFFHEAFFYNETTVESHFSMPRVTVLSQDKKYFFTMSLINASLMMEVDSTIDLDSIILEVNKNMQYFYDVLKRIYDLDFLYSSIKLEIIDEEPNPLEKLKELLQLPNEKYESLAFKKGIIKDNYYINYNIELCKEFNFNIVEQSLSEEDLIDTMMLISLSRAKLNCEYLFWEIEVNDRYAYNHDSLYRTSKESMRGMILELRSILEKIEKSN